MSALTEQQKAAYLHRSYTAVDGLWFMKVEERYGFDKALAIDEAVWQVLAKIQARTMKELLGVHHGVKDLREAFTAKLELDGFDYEVEESGRGRFCLRIERCPWCEMLEKAERGHLRGPIAEKICMTEYAVWAREFGPGIEVERGEEACGGPGQCRVCFVQS